MAQSTLLGDEQEEIYPPGHSIADLGPSDSSDSGSDIVGGPGLGGFGRDDDETMGIPTGASTDAETRAGAGADVGDAELDGDSDSGGTGERRTAGRDSQTREAGDIATDRVTDDPGGLTYGADPEGIGVSQE